MHYYFSNMLSIRSPTNTNSILYTYFDFMKAFDIVPQPELLHKLRNIGISGTLLKWFSNYLMNRKQLVSINGNHSTILPVSSGVLPWPSFVPCIYTSMIFHNMLTTAKFFYLLMILNVAIESRVFRISVIYKQVSIDYQIGV